MPMDSSNIYDSVFKTMMHKTPKLLIPLINEVFGRRYEIDAPIVQFNKEHEGPLGTRISDSIFRIEDMVYHLECQSTHDASMVVNLVPSLEGGAAPNASHAKRKTLGFVVLCSRPQRR